MQRFTVRITHQPGRKLGLVLSDIPVEDDEACYFDSSDDDVCVIRGGGGHVDVHHSAPAEADNNDENNENGTAGVPPVDDSVKKGADTGGGGGSRQLAAATAEAMLGLANNDAPAPSDSIGDKAVHKEPKMDKKRPAKEEGATEEDGDAVMAEAAEAPPAKKRDLKKETDAAIQAYLPERKPAPRKPCKICQIFHLEHQYAALEWAKRKDNVCNRCLDGGKDETKKVVSTSETKATDVLEVDGTDPDEDKDTFHPREEVQIVGRSLFTGRSLLLDFADEAASAAKTAKKSVGAAAKAVQKKVGAAAKAVTSGVKAATKAAQGTVGSKAKAAGGSKPKAAQSHKRKRATMTKLCVGEKSVVLEFAERIIAMNDDGGNDATGPGLKQMLEPSNLEKVAPFKSGRMSIPIDNINTDVLAFALTGTIQRGDIVEKVQYTRSPTANASSNGRKKSASWKRRSRPYYRSDHYTTFLCENANATELVTILTNPKNYPLDITFKRRTVSDNDSATGDVHSPPRKRLKKSESCNQPGDDGVIDLLDSSDEEEEEVTNEKDAKMEDVEDAKAQASTETKDSNTTHPQSAPPDPPKMNFYDDDFVLTPYGPGKILSQRVERHASLDSQVEGTIFKPTIIYSIDLHYGTCHVPASSVKPITGTEYTEKVLLTYQRVPVTPHDLLRLRPMTYLNDSIINFYLKYIKAALHPDNGVSESRTWDDLDGEGIHIFPSFCYTRIKNIMGPSGRRNSAAVRSKIWKDLKTWTKNTDLFKKKLLVFPINESLHWTCVFVCNPGRLVRRYAKDLPGRKGNVIDLESKAKGPVAPKPAGKPAADDAAIKDSLPTGAADSEKAVPSNGSNAGGEVRKPDAAKDETADADAGTANPTADSVSDNGSSSADRGATKPSDGSQSTDAAACPMTPQPTKSAGLGQKWQCDFCEKAQFYDFDEAVEHEKTCDDNVDRCLIHFDSGTHFKLHDTNEILGNVRKYLHAYYEAEYSTTHPGLSSFTKKNMPGFAATVPQQDNTKDCGVFMLENVERMLRHPPSVDNAFVKKKGLDKGNFFGGNRYDKPVIEKKRDDILQLIQTLRRGETKIE